jgi:hypothetical protein
MWGAISAMNQPQFASCAIGVVVGLISGSIFAVILRRVERKQPLEAIKALFRLAGFVLGAGFADYAIFDFILKADTIYFYMDGLAIAFIPFAIVTLVLWHVRS